MTDDYGSQLLEINKFYVSWRKDIRKLPYRTHCDLLPYICDDCPPNEQLYFRIISLCKSLANTDNNLSRICYAHAVSGSGFYGIAIYSHILSMGCTT